MFSIDESGVIRLRDISALNSSTAHLVAIATDTGIPPRQTSVPVIVHLPEAVMYKAGNSWPASSSTIILIFGSILGILGLIIIILILYIHKHKRPKSENRNNKTDGLIVSSIEPEKYPPNEINGTNIENNIPLNESKMDNPMYMDNNTIQNPNVPPINSQYTATVKSIMARNTASRVSHAGPKRSQNQNPVMSHSSNKHKIAPAPPIVPKNESRSPSPNNNRNQNKGGISWPTGSIPRRVKKLSWDDESDNAQRNKTEMDPDVSVTPLGTDMKTSDQMNLTVYF